MQITRKWRRPILLTSLILTAAAASVLAIGVYSKMRPGIPGQKIGPSVYDAQKIKQEQIPQITSKVKDLQIVGVSISDEGTDLAALQIGILNNSDKAVIAYEFSATDGQYFANRGRYGSADADNPTTLIAPHSYATFDWNLHSIFAGMPIYLSAARFADGSEDGDAQTIKMMRKEFERTREAKAKEKEVPK